MLGITRHGLARMKESVLMLASVSIYIRIGKREGRQYELIIIIEIQPCFVLHCTICSTVLFVYNPANSDY